MRQLGALLALVALQGCVALTPKPAGFNLRQCARQLLRQVEGSPLGTILRSSLFFLIAGCPTLCLSVFVCFCSLYCQGFATVS